MNPQKPDYPQPLKKVMSETKGSAGGSYSSSVGRPALEDPGRSNIPKFLSDIPNPYAHGFEGSQSKPAAPQPWKSEAEVKRPHFNS
mmetsp:Transcript_9401/g.16087  ORF Transcript_9401/g.16087 Transcript_9401/m.16087 type:complete len:86 (+) Transcript_9401:138-395(+)